MSTICFQMANWKNIFAKNFTFLFFLGRPGTFFWFFSLNHFRIGRQNCIFHAKKNISIRKIFWQNFLFILSGLWGKFSETSIEVFEAWLSKLRLRCSDEHFEKGYGLWGNFLKLSLNYFRLDCQNYSLRVQRSTLRKVIFFSTFSNMFSDFKR